MGGGRLWFGIGLVWLGTAAGCVEHEPWTEVEVSDEALFGEDPALEDAPYAVGAMVVAVFDRNGMPTFEVESLDPAVCTIEWTGIDAETGDVVVLAVAAGPGTTELVFRGDTGAEMDSLVVDVGLQDRFELHASGPMQLRLDPEETGVQAPKVLAGGTAAFHVRYFAGGQRLQGSDLVRATVGSGLPLEIVETTAAAPREWIRVSPSVAGVHEVELYVGSVALGPVPIEAVEEEAIRRVELVAADEANLRDGDVGTVLAVARDDEDAPIYGVDLTWAVDGSAVPGQGDLYRYRYDEGSEVELAAERGGHGDALVVHGVGEPATSTELGCASSGGAGSGWVFLAVLPLLLRRRSGA